MGQKKWIILVLTAVFLVSGTSIQAEDNGFQFVFFTDVHLQQEKNAVYAFDKAIQKINQLQPDFVISGGDNITDALGQTFETADRLYNLYGRSIKKLKMPIYHVLGNHDVFGIYKESGVKSTHPEFGKKMFSHRLGKTHYAFSHKGWHFIILDSVLLTEEGKYVGGVDDTQVQWLQRHTSGLDRKTPIVIVLHIPFYSIMPQMDPRFKTEVFTINNSGTILSLFANLNLKLVLQGHVHYHEVIKAGGVTYISGGAVCANWWDGPHQGIEEGFLLVSVEENNFTWEYIDYGWDADKN